MDMYKQWLIRGSDLGLYCPWRVPYNILDAMQVSVMPH